MIELIPAIDIIGGQCVRLTKGDYDAKKTYDAHPEDVAKRFYDMGVRRLHVVDLDGAKADHIVNLETLKKITALGMTVDFGGGIKQESDLQAAFDNGAAMVAVHGRTRVQMYAGQADWDIIRDVKQAVSVPVIGNGDVDSVESAEDMLKTTGCDGIMVGRGCYGRPWLFRELICHFEGLPYTPPENSEIREVIRRQIRLLEADRGTKALLEMRKHLSKYCRGGVGSAKLREKINSVSTREEIEELIKILFP